MPSFTTKLLSWGRAVLGPKAPPPSVDRHWHESALYTPKYLNRKFIIYIIKNLILQKRGHEGKTVSTPVNASTNRWQSTEYRWQSTDDRVQITFGFSPLGVAGLRFCPDNFSPHSQRFTIAKCQQLPNASSDAVSLHRQSSGTAPPSASVLGIHPACHQKVFCPCPKYSNQRAAPPLNLKP